MMKCYQNFQYRLKFVRKLQLSSQAIKTIRQTLKKKFQQIGKPALNTVFQIVKNLFNAYR